MDLRQMRYFVAVARERNFTRAAQMLNIAQPPLSRQIQLLEEELGVPLVLRNSRPVRLTDAGRLFHEHALQVLGRVEQMQAATRRVGLNQNRVLSIGFVASTLYGGLPVLVRKLRQKMPDLDIQLLELLSVQQIPALKEGRIDIGFGRLRQSDPGVTSTVIYEERLALAVPPDSPLGRESGTLPFSALSGEKLIVYPKEPRPSYADQVLTLVQEADIRLGEVQEVREIQTALGLVAAAAGLCIIPASARQMRADLQFRLIEDPRAVSPVIVSHRAGDTSPWLSMVQDLLAEIIESAPPWMERD
ncbi:LysR family transcriptional regulator [Xinfangfangia pollutisoli]|uniref:LysR family transcriptional regulator n=1 Tax=Xinfangfangia pollutisoli TaxID=2865960 RepID=UPI001CD691A8|nr:LysR family transcriptional regulator [Xinfangfangia pollutisoli]